MGGLITLPLNIMTVIQLPEIKKKEFKGYTKDRLEEILQSQIQILTIQTKNSLQIFL